MRFPLIALMLAAVSCSSSIEGTTADSDRDGYTVDADCNDAAAAVHPGAIELCGNGIDEDCSGSDLSCSCADADGDGALASACGGTDCNDADDAIHPGATEVCGDAIDQDCAGDDQACLSCGEGLIASACMCGGARYDGGSCCGDAWQTGACEYTVGGTIAGLTGTAVLQNNGGDDLTLGADGAFAFTMPLAQGAAYDVTVLTHPSEQVCIVSQGSGTVAVGDVTNVSVVCGVDYRPIDPDATNETKYFYKHLGQIAAQPGFAFGHHLPQFTGQDWTDPTGLLDDSDMYRALGDWGYSDDNLASNPDYEIGTGFSNKIGSYLNYIHRGNSQRTGGHSFVMLRFIMPNPVTGKYAKDTSGEPMRNLLPAGQGGSDGSGNANFRAMMDDVVELCAAVAPYPMIVRFWNEFNLDGDGGQWWESDNCTASEFINGWHYMVEYVQSQGCHNILWAFDPSSPRGTGLAADPHGYNERWPGNNYVDICQWHDTWNSADETQDFWVNQRLVKDSQFVVSWANSRRKIAAMSVMGVKGPGEINATSFFSSALEALESDPLGRQLAYLNAYSNRTPTAWAIPLPHNVAQYEDLVGIHDAGLVRLSADLPRMYEETP